MLGIADDCRQLIIFVRRVTGVWGRVFNAERHRGESERSHE